MTTIRVTRSNFKKKMAQKLRALKSSFQRMVDGWQRLLVSSSSSSGESDDDETTAADDEQLMIVECVNAIVECVLLCILFT